MRIAVALVLAFLSTLLLYMFIGFSAIALSPGSRPSSLFLAVMWLALWPLTTWLFYRGARTVSAVIRRGSLVGAAEWVLLAIATVALAGRSVAETAEGASSAGQAGAVIGGGLVAGLGIGVSIAGAALCLIVFAIAYFTGRELADRTGTATKKCPECAEMVQPEAKRCKHCGSSLLGGVAA